MCPSPFSKESVAVIKEEEEEDGFNEGRGEIDKAQKMDTLLENILLTTRRTETSRTDASFSDSFVATSRIDTTAMSSLIGLDESRHSSQIHEAAKLRLVDALSNRQELDKKYTNEEKYGDSNTDEEDAFDISLIILEDIELLFDTVFRMIWKSGFLVAKLGCYVSFSMSTSSVWISRR
eukprot:CAMPEP_0185731240 /NCGR_PEP_ID=MMETSP1171-20130828/12325_1 /TAXON_ID=374046 /ORGANISM="Helicotheca tamensis, Strain CCMP826" /LENGTH=177 /DNA_ID=CAMNT_0028400467 /DNA_START=525 /DNA_END=1056 /DNA_ORIENTATION=-